MLWFLLIEEVWTFSVKAVAVKVLMKASGRAVPLIVQVKMKKLRMRRMFLVVLLQNFTQAVITMAVIAMTVNASKEKVAK